MLMSCFIEEGSQTPKNCGTDDKVSALPPYYKDAMRNCLVIV
jgi:hypothetical protein